MSSEKLSELHEILKEPLRRKILLELGRHDGVSLDVLVAELKVGDSQEVLSQLKILGNLVSITEAEFILNEQGVTKKAGGLYKLTERGYYAVNELIAFPELQSDNYAERVEKKFFSKRAQRKHRLIYLLAGALMGYVVAFFGSVVFSLVSRSFGGPTFFFSEGWPYLFAILVVAPLLGMPLGYLIGEKRNFKHPEPNWES
jgi:hypothetical protein